MKKLLIRFRKVNNKGFSLVELVISFAILAIIALAVLVIMNAGTNMFTRVDKEVNVQYSSQTAMSQLQQYFMGASGGICRDEDNEDIYFIVDTSGNKIYAFYFYDDENKIFFYQIDDVDKYDTFSIGAQDEVFCSDVSDFKVEFTSETDKNNDIRASSAKITLTISKNGSSYTTTQIVSFRNEPLYVTEPDEEAGYDTALETLYMKLYPDVMPTTQPTTTGA